MRIAAKGLFRLPQIGQAVYKRGMPEGLRSRTTPLYEAEMFDILQAYGTSRSREGMKTQKLHKPLVFGLEDARTRLKRAIMGLSSDTDDWTALDSLLPTKTDFQDDIPAQSIRASSLLAGLELAKEGDMELRQTGAFAPIYVRGTEPKNRKKEAS